MLFVGMENSTIPIHLTSLIEMGFELIFLAVAGSLSTNGFMGITNI